MGQPTSEFVLNKLQKNVFLQILIIVGGVAIGLFAFILPIRNDVPISCEEAQTYSGYFEKYDSWSNYRDIYFTDGSSYSVYPHTESKEFRTAMETMEKGTKLFLSVNPKSGNVIEVRTETEELLNFETSQKEIYQYSKWYVLIGVLFCICPVLIVILLAVENNALKKETVRQKKQKEKVANGACGIDTPFLRNAETTGKCKILLSADVENYKIVYRRVKSVNELIVNGKVYDEKKAVFEFAHNLSAIIDDHTIEAGWDSDSYNSYIRFDGETVNEKKRIV